MALFEPLVRSWRLLRRWLPPANFITLHYTYFLATCMTSAIIFWGASTPAHSVRFIDALFLTVSAMTLSGLNTVNLSELNTFQQILLFLLIMVGSAIFVSAFVVNVRKRAFEKKFQIIVERKRQKNGVRRRTTSLSLHRTSLHELGDLRRASVASDSKESMSGDKESQPPALVLPANASAVRSQKGTPRVESAIADDEEDETMHSAHLTFSSDTRFQSSSAGQGSSSRHRIGFGAPGDGLRQKTSLDVVDAAAIEPLEGITRSVTAASGTKRDPNRYFDVLDGWITRNSQFHGLTERERERLGGYEYRAVALLSWLVPAYYVLFQLLGCLGCGAWVAYNRPDTAGRNGLNPWWVGAFNAVSAFSKQNQFPSDAQASR